MKISNRIFLLCKVTNVCNQYCKHCISNANDTEKSIQSLSKVEKLLNDISCFEKSIVSFIGGEVTTWEPLKKILKKTRDLNILIKINTNGTIIDDSLLEEIIKYDLFELRISIDSFRDREHDFFRGKGTFKKVVQLLSKISKKNINITTATVISKININLLENLIVFLSKYNIKIMHFFPYIPIGRGKNFKEVSLSQTEIRNAKKIVNDFVSKNTKNTKRKSLCGHGTAYYSITSNGDFFIHCESHKQKKLLGNYENFSLIEYHKSVINSSRFDLINCKECVNYNDPLMCKNINSSCITDIDLRNLI